MGSHCKETAVVMGIEDQEKAKDGASLSWEVQTNCWPVLPPVHPGQSAQEAWTELFPWLSQPAECQRDTHQVLIIPTVFRHASKNLSVPAHSPMHIFCLCIMCFSIVGIEAGWYGGCAVHCLVREALTAEHKAPEGGDSQGQINRLSPFIPLINTCISPGLLRFVCVYPSIIPMYIAPFFSLSPVINLFSSLCHLSIHPSTHYPLLTRFVGWVMLKMFASVFGSIQVNLNHLPALHRASQEGSLLVYVYVRQSIVDCALLPLVLFCRNLRVPYTVCPLQINSSSLRSILQKVGVILLPPSALTEQDAEMDSLYSPVMTSLVRELLHEGQAISVSVSAESGRGGQWLAHIRQLIKEGSVPDVSLVPVGISYDCVPKSNIQVEACKQALTNTTTGCVFGRRRMLWFLPPSPYTSELKEPTHPERDLSIAITLHLIFCRKDPFIVARPSHTATLHLTLQAQIVTHTFILEAVGACAVSAMLCEVAGSGVSNRVRSDGVDGEEVKGDMEFDVVLCQSELTERALQLCHLLPPGFLPYTRIFRNPEGITFSTVKNTDALLSVKLIRRCCTEPCQSSQSFALDAVDSLVRCGILIMEEINRDIPICDFWKKEGALTWTTTDDPYHSDSDCEEQDLRSYKISQPSQCPEMLFFLCSMLAGHLRALCWATAGLDLLHTPLPEAEFVAQIHSHLCDTAKKKKQHYESCSEEAAHTAVRTLIDLGVLSEGRQRGGVFLGVSPLFQLSENRQKLHRFISQYLYN
ncbi:hypothetical protein L3Q82_023161 [Scortum barcoo]|uniref:Uncharacterized protein n=1 Tax=Scortum barcoo TaxID=214431 RepID=A0ACB8WYI1_9TELE|nr:hypothetical protein L3Q82_023161 [Scortum barcoo]